MVQIIKNVSMNSGSLKSKSQFNKDEVIYFDEDENFNNYGGHVSNNLQGLSSTLNYNLDEGVSGANVIPCDSLACLTNNIMNGE